MITIETLLKEGFVVITESSAYSHNPKIIAAVSPKLVNTVLRVPTWNTSIWISYKDHSAHFEYSNRKSRRQNEYTCKSISRYYKAIYKMYHQFN